MDCDQCQLLESIRYNLIKRYCQLFEERKRTPAKATVLTPKIEDAEWELNQAWRELDIHRRSHEVAAGNLDIQTNEPGKGRSVTRDAMPTGDRR
jgi:hypothetical protein